MWYIPRYYIDRTKIKKVKDLEAGKEQTLLVELVSWERDQKIRSLTVSKAVFRDETGYMYGVWFNQAFLKKNLKPGDKLFLSGKVDFFKNRWEISSPDYELFNNTESLEHGRLVPVYDLTSGINQRFLRKLIHDCLEKYSILIKEYLPERVISENHLLELGKAITEIHFPESENSKELARYRLIFQELFNLQLLVLLRKEQIKKTSSLPLKSTGMMLKPFLESLPFVLTEDQVSVIETIKKDLAKNIPMNRLLHGEVGSGKTVVAIAVALIAIENNTQAVIIAPTEVLAMQHFALISEMLEPKVKCALLTGSILASKKKTLLGKIASGEINLIVGTHALLEDPVNFSRLGLVVIDEQHRFGVAQRWKIKSKGNNPHLLVMSATPIPRTLILTLYGDLEVSTIKELPKGRGKIKTYWVDSASRAKVYGLLKKQVLAERQGYIICPAIEESDKLELKAVTTLFEELKTDLLTGVRLDMVHGRLPSRELEAKMNDFKEGKIDVLIATSVVEVGVDVKNANFLVVEDAHRFGLSQLHQLRGRIRRGNYDGYCFLISDPASEESVKRLKIMVTTDNGFLIAEEDLKIRGTGELTGLRQHGLSEFKIANPLRDLKILELAKKEVEKILLQDPFLSREEHKLLKSLVTGNEDSVDLMRV
ncbi:MAG: ATP-dependent DNA helicase RecG [candidate division WS2 bacterium]|nr:ATP-dependent DNA helicase RecG [Candidatus Lithacetigena glycinireducens]